MKDLISKLDEVQHLSPDEIVQYVSTPTVFDVRTYRPWKCPKHLKGRHVLIEGFGYSGVSDWWRASGRGSSYQRDEGVAWEIELAFDRFNAREHYRPDEYYVILHLLEPGHAQIPDPNTRRDRSPWA